MVARGLWGTAEAAVTVGLVLLLLVVHQVWWTSRQAREGAERKVQALEREWAGEPGGPGEPDARGPGAGKAPTESGGGGGGAGSSGQAGPSGRRAAAQPRAPRWDQAYAVLRIPRIGVTAPVAQGVGESAVLNRGYVGHYPRTAQPGRAGNVALAGHRNTHGEPFRYINRLRPGDELRIDTAEGRFTYRVAKILPQTSARDSTVIDRVPRSSVKPAYGFSEPGYYVTLTTCTPEYTSKYRLVVWGRLEAVAVRGGGR
ncbi:class E sortase [Streptomyces sp. NPDC004647]|uniref:class E sortase n=1 Tax=Streptomyces sp. NPDC004647 TaxID=3154671 RepID=UPI0033B669B6